MSDESTDRRQTPADVHLLEAVELAIEDRDAYPEGAEFMDFDQPWVGKAIAEATAEGRAVVLCTPDGRRLVVQAPRPAVA